MFLRDQAWKNETIGFTHILEDNGLRKDGGTESG
jgi:hypothetical protein